MTFYKKYNDQQRNDPELRKAVEAELRQANDHFSRAKELLQAAYKELQLAGAIEEDELDQSSGLMEARMSIHTAIRRFEYKIKSKPTPTYIGNVAASMSPEKVKELKEKYAKAVE